MNMRLEIRKKSLRCRKHSFELDLLTNIQEKEKYLRRRLDGINLILGFSMFTLSANFLIFYEKSLNVVEALEAIRLKDNLFLKNFHQD